MSTKITAALALFMGFIGGAISHCFFSPIAVHAQAPVQAPAEIRAQKFILVDENGTPRGVFGFRGDGTPDIQISFGKLKGRLFGGNDAGSVRWLGVDRKDTMSDLSLTHR